MYSCVKCIHSVGLVEIYTLILSVRYGGIPAGVKYSMPHYRLILWPLSWYPLLKSRHCNQFEHCTPVYLILSRVWDGSSWIQCYPIVHMSDTSSVTINCTKEHASDFIWYRDKYVFELCTLQLLFSEIFWTNLKTAYQIFPCSQVYVYIMEPFNMLLLL